MTRVELFKQIESEREQQDSEWGGPEHDDSHNLGDWINFIDKQVNRAEECDETDLAGARGRLIKVAALAVAAIESIDRKLDLQPSTI